MPGAFNIATGRSRFPSLNQDQVFLDNAGGSQALGDVIDSISKYLSHTNVQLGASYNTSRESTSRYVAGCKATAKYMNADDDEVVLGGSTTQLFRNLSFAMRFSTDSEMIISKIDHESNINPWLDMATRNGMKVKWWEPASRDALKLTAESLKPLLSEKTKFVACSHTSNILGTIHDILSVANMVHSIPGAILCVDGVSYAPHRQIDVRALDVDIYGFSWYKVYGPHISSLYVRRSIHEKVQSMGHYFNPHKSLSDKISLAAANYELTQTIPIIVDYLGGASPKPVFEAIAAHEEKLQTILLHFLNSRDDITVHGLKSADSMVRVPTISFTVKGMGSRKVVEEAEKISKFGFRWGSFYSKRLCDEVLSLDEEGVVRVSAVHYNTEEEIKGLVEVLKDVLP